MIADALMVASIGLLWVVVRSFWVVLTHCGCFDGVSRWL